MDIEKATLGEIERSFLLLREFLPARERWRVTTIAEAVEFIRQLADPGEVCTGWTADFLHDTALAFGFKQPPAGLSMCLLGERQYDEEPEG